MLGSPASGAGLYLLPFVSSLLGLEGPAESMRVSLPDMTLWL